MALTLTSSAFAEGETVPGLYTCDGKDLSPALKWSEPPTGTQSFALIMDDPDAPPGTWVHWVLYDLPPTTRELKEGFPKDESFSDGSKHGASWGVKTYERAGYGGPCPPPGAPHRYYFKLYALDRKLGLPAKATKAEVEQAMQGHVLAETSLMGRYGRKAR